MQFSVCPSKQNLVHIVSLVNIDFRQEVIFILKDAQHRHHAIMDKLNMYMGERDKTKKSSQRFYFYYFIF